jgi:formylmethanofuran dehydrogenase subunit E
MAKIAAAQARLFKNIFICKDCSSRIRTDSLRVMNGKVSCRKCKGKSLRPIRKK